MRQHYKHHWKTVRNLINTSLIAQGPTMVISQWYWVFIVQNRIHFKTRVSNFCPELETLVNACGVQATPLLLPPQISCVLICRATCRRAGHHYFAHDFHRIFTAVGSHWILDLLAYFFNYTRNAPTRRCQIEVELPVRKGRKGQAGHCEHARYWLRLDL